jgi:hypothetical protein
VGKLLESGLFELMSRGREKPHGRWMALAGVSQVRKGVFEKEVKLMRG